MRLLFEEARNSDSGVQGLFALASICLQCDSASALLNRMRKMDPREAESLFGKVRGFELGKDEGDLLVFLSGGFQYEIKLLYSVLGLSGDYAARQEAFDIVDSWIGGNPDFPLVPLVYPADAASRVRQRFGSAKTQSSSHKSTAILVGSIASAALYSASKALRN